MKRSNTEKPWAANSVETFSDSSLHMRSFVLIGRETMMTRSYINYARLIFVLLMVFTVFCLNAEEAKGEKSEYIETVNQWTSYEDVANWLKENYSFSRGRQKIISRNIGRLLRQLGPEGAWSTSGMIQSPDETFRLRKGHCKDAALFAIDALNRINPEYNARFVFIRNRKGQPHHWVTGFKMNGKLYIMDYGAGPKWSSMNGLHGPYSTLDEYEGFLSSLDIWGFAPAWVEWKDY